MTRTHVAQGVGAIALIVVGVVAGVAWTERHSQPRGSGTSAGSTVLQGDRGDAKSDEPVEVALTPEAVERAGIKTTPARSAPASATLTVPGTITSNAYRDTKVNALVGGVIRQVMVELGAAATRGQPLTVIFSTELADAQMKYLAMQAMLDADHQKLERTQQLVTLGAASRQELEEITAIHTGHETEVAAARQRLQLLGLGPDDVSRLTDAAYVVAEVTVRAPADGVVIARGVNPGQVVSAGARALHGHQSQYRLGDRRSLREGFPGDPCRKRGDRAGACDPGGAAARACRLHRPARRSGHANRQGPRGGDEQGRRSPTGHVRDA